MVVGETEIAAQLKEDELSNKKNAISAKRILMWELVRRTHHVKRPAGSRGVGHSDLVGGFG